MEIKIAELKGHLSRGRTRKRGAPRLDELHRQGVIRRGTGGVREWLSRHRPLFVAEPATPRARRWLSEDAD